MDCESSKEQHSSAGSLALGQRLLESHTQKVGLEEEIWFSLSALKLHVAGQSPTGRKPWGWSRHTPDPSLLQKEHKHHHHVQKYAQCRTGR